MKNMKSFILSESFIYISVKMLLLNFVIISTCKCLRHNHKHVSLYALAVASIGSNWRI